MSRCFSLHIQCMSRELCFMALCLYTLYTFVDSCYSFTYIGCGTGTGAIVYDSPSASKVTETYVGKITLHWCHNDRDDVSNHQPHDCLLSRLFRRRSKKRQSSASLAFVRGIHRWPVNSPHKGPVTRKMFPFDDVITNKIHQNTIKCKPCVIKGYTACIERVMLPTGWRDTHHVMIRCMSSPNW